MITRTNIVSEKGQMAVELAVTLPIVLLFLVISVDALVFASECARFDHLACQSVLACAASPGKDGYELDSRTSAIQSNLEADFAKQGSRVEVSAEDAGVPLASMNVFRCTFFFSPWPLSAAGAPLSLEHSCNLAIDPYTPGELL